MIDLKNKLKSAMAPIPVNKPTGIVESKYMLVIKRYPNGQEYQSIFPISSEIKTANRNKKQKVKKELGEVEVQKEESY